MSGAPVGTGVAAGLRLFPQILCKDSRECELWGHLLVLRGPPPQTWSDFLIPGIFATAWPRSSLLEASWEGFLSPFLSPQAGAGGLHGPQLGEAPAVGLLTERG